MPDQNDDFLWTIILERSHFACHGPRAWRNPSMTVNTNIIGKAVFSSPDIVSHILRRVSSKSDDACPHERRE